MERTGGEKKGNAGGRRRNRRKKGEWKKIGMDEGENERESSYLFI